MSIRLCGSLLLVPLLAAAALGKAIGPAHGQDGSKRIALVVGVSGYQNVTPLTNPINDAADIAAKLKSLQFEVLLATNPDQGKFTSLLQEFKSKVTREHVALFFYAGHGVTVNRESFLLPVDVPAVIGVDGEGEPQPEALNKQLVGMASVLEPLQASKIGIVFLDACRTNVSGIGLNLRVVSLGSNRAVPLLRGTGSLDIKPSPHSAGVFRAYATQLDNVASDGTGRNSPFTKALLQHIGTKGLSIQELMIRVRKSVIADTKNEQVPWEEAALNETFYFVAPAKPTPTAGAPASKGTAQQPARRPSTGGSAGSRPGSTLPPNVGVGVGTGL